METKPSVVNTRPGDERFAFIRVPKVASTLITSRYRLDTPVSIDQLACEIQVFGMIRDPVARFLSSIPETLFRVTSPQSRTGGNVAVTDEIFERLRGVGMNIGKCAEGFLELIEEYGFFDGHHQPQSHFFSSKTKRHAVLYSVENIDSLMATLDKLTTVRNLNRFFSANDGSKTKRPWSELSSLREIPNSRRLLGRRERPGFYSELLRCTNKDLIQSNRIFRDLYERDIENFHKLKAMSSKNVVPNIELSTGLVQ